MTVRNPIAMTQARPVDEVELERKCAQIVASFDRYLDHYPSKNRKSKHAVMGPVARVIDLLKVKGASAEHAIGFAMRMHEMNPKAKGFVTREAVEALETGTRELLALVQTLPVIRLPRALERIDYSLYYERRKKGIRWFEQIRRSFAEFAAKRAVSFEEEYFPSTKPERLRPLTDAQRQTVAAFWQERPDLDRLEADEDEDEEEETK